MVINKIILKEHKTKKEVSIPYLEFPGCGASFLLENRVPPPFCPSYYPGWRLHHLHTMSF